MDPPPSGVAASAGEESRTLAGAGELAALLQEIRDRLPPPTAPTVAQPRRSRRRGRIHRFVKKAEPWSILFAAIGLFLALFTFWVDYRDQVEERTVRAWQLLTTRASGNSGKLAALEYLNREDGLLCVDALQGRLGWLHGAYDTSCLIPLKGRTPLAGVDLAPMEPKEIGLAGSDRRVGAYLRGADLRGADLRNADLTGAYLTGAYLTDADLRGALLRAAFLITVDLHGADLHDADLTGAGLISADLRGAVGLTQEQLDRACGNERTKLPEGLTIKPCER